MCYFNRVIRVARWLADYLEWLQSCWDFVKPPRNDEIALQHFFSCLQQCKNFFSISFVLHAILFFQQALAGNFFSKSPTPPPPFPFKSSMVGPLAPEKKFATEWDQQRFQKNFSRFYRDGDKRDNKKTERGPVGAGRGEYFPKEERTSTLPQSGTGTATRGPRILFQDTSSDVLL